GLTGKGNPFFGHCAEPTQDLWIQTNGDEISPPCRSSYKPKRSSDATLKLLQIQLRQPRVNHRFAAKKLPNRFWYSGPNWTCKRLSLNQNSALGLFFNASCSNKTC